MKKGIVMILTVFCILTVCYAADAGAPAPLRLYAPGEQGDVWIGNAAFLTDGMALTSGALLPGDWMGMYLTDGERKWPVTGTMDGCGGAAVFLFCNTGEETGMPDVWPIRMEAGLPRADSLRVMTGNGPSGAEPQVLNIAPLTLLDTECMLIRTSAPVTPGSPVVTAGNELAGVVIAEYAEGLNRYAAVTMSGVSRLVLSAVGLRNDQSATEGYRLTADGNAVTFDWSETPPDAIPGSGMLFVTYRDAANGYFCYVAPGEETTSFSVLLVPGRSYCFALCRAAEKPDGFPDGYAAVTVPEAEKLTDHAFRPLTTSLAVAPENGLGENELPVPVQSVTRDELRSGRVHFYTSSAYEVAEQISDTLVVAMTLPAGSNVFWTSGWSYMPEIMNGDTWSQPLDAMGFTEIMAMQDYPAGTYEISFYIGGKQADSFTFVLDWAD